MKLFNSFLQEQANSKNIIKSNLIKELHVDNLIFDDQNLAKINSAMCKCIDSVKLDDDQIYMNFKSADSITLSEFTKVGHMFTKIVGIEPTLSVKNVAGKRTFRLTAPIQ